METKIFFPASGMSRTAGEGDTLLDVIRAAGLQLEAVCAGRGVCGKCKVRVDGVEGLACQILAKDGMRVEILSSAEGQEILSDSGARQSTIGNLQPRREACPAQAASGRIAIAIDIGTTTVVVKAIDPENGEEIATRAFLNPQRTYGADVLSRINLALDDASTLSGILVSAVGGAVSDILHTEAKGLAAPEKLVIAGNTTMSYLLLGLPCRSLGLAPFEPAYGIEAVYQSPELFPATRLTCPVRIYPYISAFVGGDIVSGLVNIECHLETGAAPSYLLVDMGTNGEIAYRSGERLLTTSTAAGPALEGGNISCGMAGLPGAIYEAVCEGADGFRCETIGGLPATGICGSGVISLMAALLNAGFVEPTGAFSEKANGKKELLIVPEECSGNGHPILFTQKDVREFQLAKGAIRAGIDILIEEMGEAPETLYVAGGFGQAIELESAFRVGLIPETLRGRVRFVGNTSLGGCIDACTSGGADTPLPALSILHAAREINLGAHKSFNSKFMETMLFE